MRREHLSKTSNKEITSSTSGLTYKASMDLSPKEYNIKIYKIIYIKNIQKRRR